VLPAAPAAPQHPLSTPDLARTAACRYFTSACEWERSTSTAVRRWWFAAGLGVARRSALPP